MPYTPTTWVENVTTLGPTNLNHMEAGIAAAPYGPDSATNRLPVWNGSAWVYQQIVESQITAGTITNASISGAAAIAVSKLGQSGATSGQVVTWNGSTWAPADPGGSGGATYAPPTGSIQMFGGAAAPTGWVLCDGSSLLRAGTYAALFGVIGTTYGSADGTHFNVPDLRGRMPAGYASAGHVDVATLGNSEGTTLTSRRPKHPHTNGVTASPSLTLPNHGHSVSDPGHTHGVYHWNGGNPGGNVALMSTSPATADSSDIRTDPIIGAGTGVSVGNPTSNPAIGGTVGIGGTIGAAGTATDAPAYIVVNFIIAI